ncbi:MAG: hypothetical protein Q8K11_19480 [Phenylobacterium sp.]|nr:hypothetical protein [Phenylobacterium sp.]
MKIGAELAVALELQAKSMDMVPSRWIEALIRGRLLQVPTLSRADELAFIEVQVELRRIGVHIHHVLNAIQETAGANPAHLRQLGEQAGEIRLQLARLRAAFQGNLDDWNGAS